MKISERFSFFRDIAKHEGFGELFRLVTRRFYRKTELYVYQRDLLNLESLQTENDLTLKLAQPGELDALRLDPENFAVELYWDKFYQVRTCYLAYLNSIFIHLSWVYFSQDVNKYFPLKTEEAMIGPCLTLPSARGKGVYPKVINFICHQLKESGIKKVYMVVEKSNSPSIKGIEKAGLKRCGQINTVSILFLRKKKVDIFKT